MFVSCIVECLIAIYISRYRYFCAHDDDNDDDIIDYFTPCTCTQGIDVMDHAVSVKGVIQDLLQGVNNNCMQSMSIIIFRTTPLFENYTTNNCHNCESNCKVNN